jgi:hypothetical protein
MSAFREQAQAAAAGRHEGPRHDTSEAARLLAPTWSPGPGSSSKTESDELLEARRGGKGSSVACISHLGHSALHHPACSSALLQIRRTAARWLVHGAAVNQHRQMRRAGLVACRAAAAAAGAGLGSQAGYPEMSSMGEADKGTHRSGRAFPREGVRQARLELGAPPHRLAQRVRQRLGRARRRRRRHRCLFAMRPAPRCLSCQR